MLRDQLYRLLYSLPSYFCGHDHNLQYIQESSNAVSYFVVGAGHLSDPSEEHKVTCMQLKGILEPQAIYYLGMAQERNGHHIKCVLNNMFISLF